MAINPDRTLDEIYHAMHCFYSKDQILTVWAPEEDVEVSDPDDPQTPNQTAKMEAE